MTLAARVNLFPIAAVLALTNCGNCSNTGKSPWSSSVQLIEP